jgi:hypothetical protein
MGLIEQASVQDRGGVYRGYSTSPLLARDSNVQDLTFLKIRLLYY